MSYTHIGNVIMEKLKTTILLNARIRTDSILQINIIQLEETIYYLLFISEQRVVYLFKCNNDNYPLYRKLREYWDWNYGQFSYLGTIDSIGKLFKENKGAKINGLARMIFLIIVKTFYTENGWKMNGSHKLDIKVDLTNKIHEQVAQEEIREIKYSVVRIKHRTACDNCNIEKSDCFRTGSHLLCNKS